MMALVKPWSQDLETFQVFIKSTEADPTKRVHLKNGTEINQVYYVHAMTHIRYVLTMDQKCFLSLWKHARGVLKKVPAEEAKAATFSRDPALWFSFPLRRF